MSAQFTIPLITVIPGQLITASLWNNEFNNIGVNFIPAGMDSYSDTDVQMQIQTNPYPGSVTSHASSLGGEIERIRYQIAQITGNAFWYQPPAANLNTLTAVMVPVGGIIMFGGGSPPSNFKICDGSALDRTIYATLFAVLGTAYGIGDGTTTFNIPEMRDFMPIGSGGGFFPGSTGGNQQINLVTGQLPAHNHGINDPGHTHTITDPTHSHGVTDPTHIHQFSAPQSSGSGVYASGNNGQHIASVNTTASPTGITINNASTGVTINNASTGITTQNTGSGSAINILPPYVGMYFIIRAQ